MSVTGFDNVKLSEFCYPALTTVHIPRERIGADRLRLPDSQARPARRPRSRHPDRPGVRAARFHRASRGVAIREFPLAPGHGFADYLLYIDGYAAGVIEAKKEGVPLVAVEIQSGKYSQGLPQNLPAAPAPLLLPVHRNRDALHQPSRTRRRSRPSSPSTAPKPSPPGSKPISNRPAPPCAAACASCPLCPARASGTTARVIANLEQSLARNDPRASDPHDHGQRKDLHRLQFRLASHRPRRRPPRSLPGGPPHPRPPPSPSSAKPPTPSSTTPPSPPTP